MYHHVMPLATHPSNMAEPIPYFYDSVNRNAIIVQPKRPFFIWLNTLFPRSPIAGKDERTIYLVKQKDTVEDLEKWLVQNFDKIFKNELNDWHPKEEDWPQNRTYDMFTAWFDFDVQASVLDMEDSPLKRY